MYVQSQKGQYTLSQKFPNELFKNNFSVKLKVDCKFKRYKTSFKFKLK